MGAGQAPLLMPSQAASARRDFPRPETAHPTAIYTYKAGKNMVGGAAEPRLQAIHRDRCTDLKGQDVPSGGGLAGEQPGRSRGAACSRSGRSTELARRPLPSLVTDSFARARSRPSTSKLSMIDIVGPATKASTKGPRVSRSSLFLISSARCFEDGLHSTSIAPRSMVSTLPFSSIAKMSSWSVLLLVRTSWKSVAASLASPRFSPVLHPQIVVANSYTYSDWNVG